LVFSYIIVNAQKDKLQERPYIKKSFSIILSTKSYAEAKKPAVEAAKKLNIKLDLRGLKPNKVSGLTADPKICEEENWSYPYYTSRGRYDNGEFVTIDYSNAFEGFAKG
jgi:hypothetical protein